VRGGLCQGEQRAGISRDFLAIIPGLLAVLMVVLVKERPAPSAAKAKIDLSLKQFPSGYWRYLLATAFFGLGNSSNSFLILQTKQLGASLEMTILIYAEVQSCSGADLLSSRLSFGQIW
jgi:hypothetical protein